MDVLVFNFGDFCSPHLEIQHDVIQQHLDAGDFVTKTRCNGELPVCFVNPDHRLTFCAKCRARNRSAVNQLNQRIEEVSVFNLTTENREIIEKYQFEGKTLAALKNLKFDGFSLGMSVASFLIERHRDANLDVEKHRNEILEWLRVTLAAYLSACNYLDSAKFDQVYVFNGRRTMYRAVFEACIKRDIAIRCLDGHANLRRFTCLDNRIFHDLKAHHRDVNALWNEADPTQRDIDGREFFTLSRKGETVINFIGGQKCGELPKNWNPIRRNIVFFQSSEFELAAVSSEFDMVIYRDQYDALKTIVEEISKRDQSTHVYFRMHPNLIGDTQETTRRYFKLASDSLTVIPPDDSVSSYSLIEAANCVITSGSTTGLEAAAMSKPSVLIAPSFYTDLGSVYTPSSHDEVMDLITKDLPSLPIEGALKYGYYMLNHGRETKHSQRYPNWKATFQSHDLNNKVPWLWKAVLKVTQSRIGPSIDKYGGHHKRICWKRILRKKNARI